MNGEGPCEFQERMDKEYKALGDHPSLKTELFLHYRNKRSEMGDTIESCLKGGSYPRNQKLKNLYKQQKKKFENCYRLLRLTLFGIFYPMLNAYYTKLCNIKYLAFA